MKGSGAEQLAHPLPWPEAGLSENQREHISRFGGGTPGGTLGSRRDGGVAYSSSRNTIEGSR